MILLNILRSAYREPMYFTTITQGSGNSQFSGTLGLSIPFVDAFESGAPGSASPSVTISDPRPTFTMSVESAQKFAQGVARDVDPVVVSQLINLSKNAELVLSLLVDRIVFAYEEKQPDGSFKKVREECVNDPRPRPANCLPGEPGRNPTSFDRILRDLLACGLSLEKDKVTSYIGPPMTKQEALAYLSSEAKAGTALVYVEKTGMWRIAKSTSTYGYRIRGDSAAPRKCPGQSDGRLGKIIAGISEKKPKEDGAAASGVSILEKSALFFSQTKNQPPNDIRKSAISFELRSTLGVFGYLGEIAAEQVRANKPTYESYALSPVIYTDGLPPASGPPSGSANGPLNREGVPVDRSRENTASKPHLLFAVCKGAVGNAITSATLSTGETYWIPADRGSAGDAICGFDLTPITDNRAGQAFGILAQLLALNRDASELKDSSTLTLVR